MSADERTHYCENCGLDLSGPKNAGFPYEGDWYCSGLCADACADFWSRGETVEDYNSQLGGER